VIEPVFDECFKGGEHFELSGTYSVQPPKDMKEIQTIIESMNEDAINSSVNESLIKSSNLLPSSIETTVCIFPWSSMSLLKIK
jgi:hypothetical protein